LGIDGGRKAPLSAPAVYVKHRAGRDEGMVLPIEHRDVAIDLNQPAPLCHN
jgi:hypothetical protein